MPSAMSTRTSGSRDCMDMTIVTVVMFMPVLVSYSMFGIHSGGSQKISSPIAWHAILMTLACPGLMTLGRWAYCSENVDSKQGGRKIHAIIMAAAVITMLIGYICVFMSHIE